MKKLSFINVLLKAVVLIPASILVIGITSCSNVEHSNSITLEEFDTETVKIKKEIENSGKYDSFEVISVADFEQRTGVLRECVKQCPELWKQVKLQDVKLLLFSKYRECLKEMSAKAIKLMTNLTPVLYSEQESVSSVFTPKHIYSNNCLDNFLEYGLVSEKKCLDNINEILEGFGFYYKSLDIKYFLGLDENTFAIRKIHPMLYMNNDQKAIILTVDLFNSYNEFNLCFTPTIVKEHDSCLLEKMWDVNENNKHCWKGKQRSVVPLSWDYINLLLHSRLPGQNVEPWRKNLFQEIEKSGLLNSIGILAISFLKDEKTLNIYIPTDHELSSTFGLTLIERIKSQLLNGK